MVNTSCCNETLRIAFPLLPLAVLVSKACNSGLREIRFLTDFYHIDAPTKYIPGRNNNMSVGGISLQHGKHRAENVTVYLPHSRKLFDFQIAVNILSFFSLRLPRDPCEATQHPSCSASLHGVYVTFLLVPISVLPSTISDYTAFYLYEHSPSITELLGQKCMRPLSRLLSRFTFTLQALLSRLSGTGVNGSLNNRESG